MDLVVWPALKLDSVLLLFLFFSCLFLDVLLFLFSFLYFFCFFDLLVCTTSSNQSFWRLLTYFPPLNLYVWSYYYSALCLKRKKRTWFSITMQQLTALLTKHLIEWSGSVIACVYECLSQLFSNLKAVLVLPFSSTLFSSSFSHRQHSELWSSWR